MSTLKVGTIQDHANSNTAINIDSGGRVTLGQKVAWHIGGTDGTGNITTSPVPWRTVILDYQNGWNDANKRYQISVTGLYHVGIDMPSDDTVATWYIEKSTNGGSSYSFIKGIQQRKPAGGNTNTITHSGIFALNANDLLRVTTDGKAYYSWGTTTYWSGFWGHLIG